MSSRVSIQIMGGLGNQLFQIFFLLAYSKKHNLRYYFPLTTSKRKTYWNDFLRSLRKYVVPSTIVKNYDIIFEYSFEYQEYPSNQNSTLFHGYFQSYLYWESHQEEIIRELRFKDLLQLVPDPHQNSISLHFRIGDYKFKQHYHPILPLNYYQKALEYFEKKKKYNIYYFFENEDVALVMENIISLQQQFPNFEFISMTHLKEDWKELLFMSKCNHHIIANSSFSWWGAYLGEICSTQSSKLIFYPSIWFGKDANYETKDLFPPRWKKIKIGSSET